MKFLITAGPTREALDPVRYLTNRSSGRMGYALAGAARHEGHEVILISGPTTLDVPAGVDFIPVESAQQMYDAVRDMVKYADAAILCAAVADYRPVAVQEQKIKKSGERMVIELEKTRQELRSHVGDSRPHRVSLFSEHVEETHRTTAELRRCDAELGTSLLYESAHGARLADAGEVAFHVRHEARHTCLAESLRQHLEGHSLTCSCRSGDESVAVRHFSAY